MSGLRPVPGWFGSTLRNLLPFFSPNGQALLARAQPVYDMVKQNTLHNLVANWEKRTWVLDREFIQFAKDCNSHPIPEAPLALYIAQQEFNHQGKLTYVDQSGLERITSVEEAVQLIIFKGVPVIETGSAKTFQDAKQTARAVADTLGNIEHIHLYLAMDPASWLREGEPIIRQIEPNVIRALPLRIANAIRNEAASQNPRIPRTSQISHSAATFPTNLSLLAFEPRAMAHAYFLQVAPLIHRNLLRALAEVKRSSRGSNAVVRGSFDWIEEVATAYAELFFDGIFDTLPTDKRVPRPTHDFVELVKSLVREDSTLEQFIAENHAERPGEVELHRLQRDCLCGKAFAKMDSS